MHKASNAVKAFLLAAGIGGFAAAQGRASVIAGVSIQSYSSQLDEIYNRHASYIVDGSGLNVNGPGTHSTTTDGTMWETTGAAGCCGGTSNNGANNADASPYIIFNLGGT